MKTIDLNCDLGEGMPSDADIMPYISSANIACGYHAGDETTMRNTIDLCLKYGVAIGAHPGFDDRKNFGRMEVQLSADEVYDLVWKQLEIIYTICKEKSARLHHVKLHGALYNMAAKYRFISRITAEAVWDFDPSLVYYGLSGSVMIEEAQALGLKAAHEVFADRTYQFDGSLTPRSQSNALIEDVDMAVQQVLQMITEHSVMTTDNKLHPLQVDTVCIHGDGYEPVHFARVISSSLKKSGVDIRSD